MLIGLISDTHIPEAAPSIPSQVMAAFQGVDAILHAGDIHDLSVLDHLGRIAPVWAARGNGEDGSGGRAVQPEDRRLAPRWLLVMGGIRIGLIHELPLPEDPRYPPDTVAFVKRHRFAGMDPPDVIVYGDSHVEAMDIVDGTLCLNPGSPTLPHNLSGRWGTVGLLEIADGVLHPSIWQLTEDGSVPYRGRLGWAGKWRTGST